MPHLNKTDFHLPYNPLLVDRAKEMRRYPTLAEKKLWQNYLKVFPYRVLRQRPIEHFIVDFYCAALKLVIEVDGDSHFSDEAMEYDTERTPVLEGYGLKVLHFTNEEVMRQFDAVCQKIQDEIPLNPP